MHIFDLTRILRRGCRHEAGHGESVFVSVGIKGRLIAILLTAGEAHDCPVAERSKRMLGDKAYDSAELGEDLHERGTKPVIPNRCNRKQPFSFNKRIYKLRWRIESAFNRLKDFSALQPATTGWREIIWPLSASPLLLYGGFNESGP
jgi:transposase